MFPQYYFDNLRNERLEAVAELKRRSLPIVMYGAAEYAHVVKRFLSANGLTVAARFVDVNYQTAPGVSYFEDVERKFDRFSVVLGMADFRRGAAAMNRRASNKVDGVYHFVLSPHYLDAIDFEFVSNHRARLEAVYQACCDELSRKSFLAYLKTQVTGDDRFLIETLCPGQYFQDFLAVAEDEVFVDAGAYVGDSLEEFLRRTDRKYRKYYAFEPDPANFEKLTEFVRREGLDRVETFCRGLGRRQEVVRFSHSGGVSTDSKICDTGNLAIPLDMIDHLCPDATFIKMDIEGAELDALGGAEQTIRANRPKLAICAYHKPSHLWELADYVRSLVPDYRIYFRQHLVMSTELVMYGGIH